MKSWESIRSAAVRSLPLLTLGVMVGAMSPCSAAREGGVKDGGVKESGAKEAQTKFSGNVSWYGPGFNGRKTASGEVFDMNKCTCAHKTLPFFTRILVENPKTGKSVIVRVTDRGPYAKGRVMDLSRCAAQKLGTLLGGVTYVECTILPKQNGGGSSL